MRLVVIQAQTLQYAVYEDRQFKAAYRGVELLDAWEVEDLRQNPPYLATANSAPEIPKAS